METTVDYLSSYSLSLDFNELPGEVIHQTKRQLIDSLGCAIGGFESEPSKIARRIASGVSCRQPATIIGSGQQTTPELATFANGIMVRYIDFNDVYRSAETKEGGHPSDNFAPVLSCAEIAHADGKRFITAAVLAYEIFLGLNASVNLREKGLDHVTNGVISSVIGASKVLGLSSDQMAQAINLALVANIALCQTRVEGVSMWKGCAFANTARNAVFAAQLASQGLTGPTPIFEGRYGFFNALGGTFKLAPLGSNSRSFRIMGAAIKPFPAGGLSLAAIEAALIIRPHIINVEDITEVNIKTSNMSFEIMAGDPEKWHPKNRETADHSIPYVIAVALMFGGVEVHHFSQDYLHNTQLIELVQKVKVTPSEECNRMMPEANVGIVEVATKSGQKFSERVDYHRGHPKNPMNDGDIEKKFLSLTRDHLNSERSKSILDLIWNLEQVEDINQLMLLLTF
ncbi:MmgE/PrpD family protein [Thermodesulfobacteriota bacterium]